MKSRVNIAVVAVALVLLVLGIANPFSIGHVQALSSAGLGIVALVVFFVLEWRDKGKANAEAINPTMVDSIIKLLAFLFKMEWAGKYNQFIVGIITLLASSWEWISAKGVPILCENFNVACGATDNANWAVIGMIIGSLVSAFGIDKK